jgi:hypothetical protein
MKNIHILPTDKPSNLWLMHNKSQGLMLLKTASLLDGIPQHIYITSDEEIKDGDWCINIGRLNETIIFPDKIIGKADYTADVLIGSNWRKIILTTNPTLIKDGVQSIDDEFLEWFVNNPSCEKVEVDLVSVNEFGSEITVGGYGLDKFIYKIIIPQEEPKQETLKQVAKRLSKDAYKKHSVKDATFSLDEQIQRSGGFIVGFKEGLKEGAKWQAERMYSEEDIYSLLDFIRNNAVETDEGWQINKIVYTNEELFEYFKKK